ncbi:MAG TPA: F0F1 ATP synthase subunit B [Planctomycetaceae bacterium]|nr:F0F1 ATP synthase subunit B [Planctomycetaceae bacterium]
MRFWLTSLSVCALMALLPAGMTVPFSPIAHAVENHAEGDADHSASGASGTTPPGLTVTKQDADLALWSLVTFVVFILVLKKFAWRPLITGLDKREMSVLDNIAAAEAARVKAEKMLAEHAAKLDKVQDEVREILAEARRDAEYTKGEIVAAAQKEAETNRQRAVQDIERARDQALDDLFDHMARCVNEATEQVIGRALTGADNERLIEEALSGFAQRKH